MCYLTHIQSVLGIKTHGNNIGSRKVEPLNAGTPLCRKYVNYGLRELARAWYGVGNYPETLSEARFFEHFRKTMHQYALAEGKDKTGILLTKSSLDKTNNSCALRFIRGG